MPKYSDITSGGGMDPRDQPLAEAQAKAAEIEALRARHVPRAEAHCATCACVPGMTPAVRFDTTPAEREGVVRDHLISMGWTPPAEAQALASWMINNLLTESQLSVVPPGQQKELRYLAQQPAAVGVPVDVVREYLDARACYDAATRPPNSHARAPVLRPSDPDAMRLRNARIALDNAVSNAQRPAAVDGAMVERAREAYYDAAEVKDGVFTDPVAMHAALTAALAQPQGDKA